MQIDNEFVSILTKIFLAITILSIMGYVILGVFGFGYWAEHQKVDCLKDKWIKGTNSQTYLVGMVSGEVYKIDDSLFKWKWRSSDLYNSLDINTCYKIDYYGWRIGFFSNYPNIIRAQEVSAT